MLFFELESVIREADDDTGEDTNSPDTSAQTDKEPSMDDTNNTDEDDKTSVDDEENNTENQNDNTDDEDKTSVDDDTGNEDNDDFSIDSTDDDTAEEDTGNGEDTSNNDGGEEAKENEESPEDDTKEKYDSLYSGLSDEEKVNKDLKLKENFKDLYETISDLIKRVNKIPNTGDNAMILKRIIKALNDLKTFIEYYIIKIYSTKSFIENDIEFNKFLAVFNGINNIFTDLEKLMVKND